MMNAHLKQRVVSSIFSKIPSYLLEELTGTNLIFLYYHMVSDDEVSHVNQLYDYKNRKQFADDIDFLLRNYVPISLHDVLDILKTGRPLPGRSFLLTFDDGFREMNDVVAPILLKKGVPATFFINSGFIDNQGLCYQHKASILAGQLQKTVSHGLQEKIEELLLEKEVRFSDIRSGILSIQYEKRGLLDEVAWTMDIDFNDYLMKNKPYLTSSQIMDLIEAGFTIGAHSIDHPLYSSLLLKDQLYQTIESVRIIRERFCLDYGAFAFPHADSNVSNEFFVELYNSGLVDVSFGTGGMIDDSFPRNFQRLSLEKPMMPAERIIALHYARKFKRLVAGDAKIKRK